MRPDNDDHWPCKGAFHVLPLYRHCTYFMFLQYGRSWRIRSMESAGNQNRRKSMKIHKEMLLIVRLLKILRGRGSCDLLLTCEVETTDLSGYLWHLYFRRWNYYGLFILEDTGKVSPTPSYVMRVYWSVTVKFRAFSCSTFLTTDALSRQTLRP